MALAQDTWAQSLQLSVFVLGSRGAGIRYSVAYRCARMMGTSSKCPLSMSFKYGVALPIQGLSNERSACRHEMSWDYHTDHTEVILQTIWTICSIGTNIINLLGEKNPSENFEKEMTHSGFWSVGHFACLLGIFSHRDTKSLQPTQNWLQERWA